MTIYDIFPTKEGKNARANSDERTGQQTAQPRLACGDYEGPFYRPSERAIVRIGVLLQTIPTVQELFLQSVQVERGILPARNLISWHGENFYTFPKNTRKY
ncbi:hypothetical protein [Burkholderia cenocepacia]|uniref:hypothetical protein n=1 Tax=Burkholderia cenocepacia TaxID=95486 RepID=UPI000FDBC604|nr:hypothetical protein [Burkholderia cenocepacia]UXZ92503.1 hypothetical protein NUJ27_24060 [Burkholderia cenocepacia]